MAACGSLEHIFEKPLSEPPTFLESLSPWKHIKSMKPSLDDSSFTEIFGELHFKENHIHSSPQESSSSSSSSSPSNSTFWADPKIPSSYNSSKSKQYGSSDHTFSCKNSESLSLCTEGLGFESFDDVEDLLNHDNKEWEHQEGEKRNSETEHHRNESKISPRTSKGEFPPPISCIGRSGKPWVCFKSYREDGRFILKEIRIPTQEFLHACRENGRLKLHFVHSESDDDILEEEEGEEEQIDDIQERDWNEREKEVKNVENRDSDLQSSS